MRINIFKQIRAFYSKVFESDFDLRPTHVSLYFFLINQNNRTNWTEWFKCPFDTVMHGALINSNKTYYSVLNDLQKFGFIEYKKGINHHKAPRIKIIPLEEKIEKIPVPEDSFTSVIITQLTTQLPTQVSEHLSKHLSKQLSKHKDILITNNYNIIITEKKIEEKKEDKKDEKQNKYIYNHFYDSELLKIEGEKYKEDYEKFIGLLYGNNREKQKLDGVLSIQDQLTYEQFLRCSEMATEKNKNLQDILLNLNNDKNYYKGKISLSLTLQNWIKRTFK